MLYYWYFADGEAPSPSTVASWFEPWVDTLVGRVRIAEEGFNATLGGNMVALEAHVEDMRGRFEAIDFQLEAVVPELEERVHDHHLRKACGFDLLRIRFVAEVVSFGCRVGGGTARRISACEWDEALATDDIVVLDVRNAYESALGRFDGAIVPDVRTSADFPRWLRQNRAVFANKKRVLAYCTGGVRCETAAKLLADYAQDVAVLRGGVLGYLKDRGSKFRGRLFVFDPRVSLPAGSLLPEASCTCCGATASDYCSRNPTPKGGLIRPRCANCRVLLLLCDQCRSRASVCCPRCRR